MSTYELPTPEPKEIDEQNWMTLQHFMERAVLRGHPLGKERCQNCLYYTDEDADLTYCWHPQIRILVGGEWWCQWWEARPEDAST